MLRVFAVEMSIYLLFGLFLMGRLALAAETCNVVAYLREEPQTNGTTSSLKKKNYNNVELFWRFDFVVVDLIVRLNLYFVVAVLVTRMTL